MTYFCKTPKNKHSSAAIRRIAVVVESCSVKARSNNPVGADLQSWLVLSQRLSAAAQPERYTAKLSVRTWLRGYLLAFKNSVGCLW